jgi:hypothetical protein
MAASLSGVFSLQEFTDAGGLMVAGRVYTFVSGTTTQKTAYTDAAGTVPHTYTSDGQGGLYIALNARGELPAPLFLAAGAYDITLKRPDGTTVWTRQAVPGSDASATVLATFNAWVTNLATLVGASLIGFIQAGVGAVLRTIQAELRDTVKIQQFGGIADGNIQAGTGTDNSPALVRAITSLGGAGAVYIPPGVYRFASQVTVPSGVTIYGAGKYCSILTVVNAFNSDGVLKCNGVGGVPTNIRGLGVIAQNGGAGAASQGINSTANGVFIDDVWVSGFNIDVTLGSSDNFLTNSAIEEAAAGGTGINIPSTDVTVADVTLYHCYIGMSVHDFAYLDGTVTITNVRANACTNESFLLSNANNVQFAGCSVGGVAGQNATAGINCITSTNVSFDGMMVHQAGTSTTAPGLLISGGTNITVDGGQFQGWLDGIQANNVSGLTVTGAQCVNNFRRGVFVAGGDRIVLTGGLSANDGSAATTDAGIYLLNTAASSIFTVAGWTCTEAGSGAQEYGIFANLTDNGVNTGYINLTGNTCLFNNTADIALSGAVQNIAYQSSGNVAGSITGGFAQVTSAATVALPAVGEVIGIFGNTTITTITNPICGRRVTLIFSSSLTVTDGSNLKLAGNLSAGPSTTLTLVGDGTNWNEASRSVN